MMGQQQETTGIGSATRRIILLLAVAAVVVAIMAASAVPAYAAGRGADNSFTHACAKTQQPNFCR